MTPEIAEIVGRKEVPRKLTEFLEDIKLKIQVSRDEMTKYYDQWDRNDMVYRGERQPDMQDVQARKRGEPEKMILPLTFGQVQTFVAFGHALYNAKDFMFEQIASGAEDEKPARIGEAVLEQNLRKNKFRSVQNIQMLTDIARFGIGITKETWVHQQCPIIEDVPDQEAMAQARQGLIQVPAVPTKRQVRYVTKYMGNKIVNISPYRWFPDARLPLSRWTEGEFVAWDNEVPKNDMTREERQGTIAGLEHVSRMGDQAFEGRRLQFLRRDGPTNPMRTLSDSHYYLLTEVEIRLNPSTTEIDDKVFLDPDLDYDAVYVVWILNDDRIVRISPANYDHEEFSFNAAQFLDDQHRFINFSLCEVLAACQDTATWLLNARITNVRKTIFNQAVIDPAGIEIDDIINRRPYIRTKPGRAGSGVSNWYQQINTQDVTTNHVNDVNVLAGMGKEATGISETLLGQFSPGRRSAKEAGNVANNAAQRLIMIFSSIWESAYEPMGRKMLSNLRQGLDEQTLVRVYGQLNTQQAAQPDIPGLPPPLYRLIKVSKADLVGSYDFAPFNGTTPSQRAQTAAVLQQIIDGMLKNPQMALMTGLDPKLLFDELLVNLNIRNVQRFQLTPERLQQLTPMAQPPANPGGPPAPGGRG